MIFVNMSHCIVPCIVIWGELFRQHSVIKLQKGTHPPARPVYTSVCLHKADNNSLKQKVVFHNGLLGVLRYF